MRRQVFLLFALLFLPALAFVAPAASATTAPDDTAGTPIEPGAFRVFAPFVGGLPALSPVDWDPRLDQRGAYIIPAEVTPGFGYWRLVKAVWYDENEPPFAGQHHIYVDTLNAMGERQPGVPIDMMSDDGNDIFVKVVTEVKPNELYAGNFPMGPNVAPAYRAVPNDGNPADGVGGMGLGSIELPDHTVHTSYGLVWQWTIARR